MREKIRIGVYVLVLVAGGVAVAFGWIDDGTATQWTGIIAGLIGIGGAGTALRHVRPATTQTVVAVQDVIDALSGEPSGKHAESHVDEVRRRRAEMEAG